MQPMEVIDYGVCRLALVAVRLKPDDREPQVTQLLFGDHYEVLAISKDGKWLMIRIFTDAYQGWIDRKQHHAVTHEYFDQINHANFKITTDLVSGILYKKNPMTILMGSIVPVSQVELFKVEEQLAFNGESKGLSQRRDFEYLKSIALKYSNAPYQWGGKSPFGIDCSALVQMAFKICGYSLSRDAHQQATQGIAIDQWSNAKPGDLAFFSNAEGQIVHVGILLEDERIIHASGHVRIDRLMEEGILNLETKIFTHNLAFLRRIMTG